MQTNDSTALATTEIRPSERRLERALFLAFAAAAVSDCLSFWITMLPPVEWLLDLATAFALFLILGRRWAILPGLITEAIPGMGVFPVWVLVVASIAVYDNVTVKPRH